MPSEEELKIEQPQWFASCTWIRSRQRQNSSASPNQEARSSSPRTRLQEGRNRLAILLRSAGRIVERDTIAKAVLGRPLAPFERSIVMHISKLRRKLGNLPGGQPRIRTVRNVGYLFASPGTAARTTKGAE